MGSFGGIVALWTYQVNPANFDMESMLRQVSDYDNVIALQPKNGEHAIAIGDVAYLCETDRLKRAGLLGVALVASLPADIEMPGWQRKFWKEKEDPDRNKPHSWMKVLFVCGRRLSRSEFKSNEILRRAGFANGYREMIRLLTPEQGDEINRLIGF